MFSRICRYIVIALIFIGILGISNAQEHTNPRFEDSVILLLQSSVRIAQPVISPDSRYVFAMTGTNESYPLQEKASYSGDTAILSLWELGDVNISRGVSELEPIQTFEIDTRVENVSDYRFSPDSTYLALRNGNQLQLLNIPELTVKNSIVLSNSRVRLGRSPNEELLGHPMPN